MYSSNLQNKKDFYMGRTLDYEFSYGEQITITPRNYEFDFRFAGKIKKPLCFDRNGICCRKVIRFIMMLLMKKALEWQVLILSAMRHMKRLCRKMKQKSARWHSSSSSHGSLHSVLL